MCSTDEDSLSDHTRSSFPKPELAPKFFVWSHLNYSQVIRSIKAEKRRIAKQLEKIST